MRVMLSKFNKIKNISKGGGHDHGSAFAVSRLGKVHKFCTYVQKRKTDCNVDLKVFFR